MSLNNRISVCDSYETRGNGKVFDCQVLTVSSCACPEAIKDSTTLVAEKHEIDLMKQPVAETEVEEREMSESCDRHIILRLSYALAGQVAGPANADIV